MVMIQTKKLSWIVWKTIKKVLCHDLYNNFTKATKVVEITIKFYSEADLGLLQHPRWSAL